MVVKVKESFEKTRKVKNNDKSKKYILRGEKNARYHEKILSNNKKSKSTLSIFDDKQCYINETESIPWN